MRRAAAVLSLCAVWMLLASASALAHPLGNFTVNAAADLEVTPSVIRVHHVVDMAEIPTVQENARIDANGDGESSATELQSWADAQARTNAPQLRVSVDGKPVALKSVMATAVLMDGQAGLATLRLEATFEASPIPEDGELMFQDQTFEAKTGWREVTLHGTGVALEGATVPTSSSTQMLRTYPSDPEAIPSAVTTASASFVSDSAAGPGPTAALPAGPGVGVVPGAAITATTSSSSRAASTDGFAGMLSGEGLSVLVVLVAAGFGAAHALAPGHGKTLMAAYMVGSGARVRQAATAGVAVAMMHTASVLALGMLILGLGSRFTPERIYPWMSLVSGAVTLLIGGRLLHQRVRTLRRQEHVGDHAGDQVREYHHGHGHDDAGHGHEHGPALPENESLLSRRGLLALAASGGILPSPTALVVLLGAIAIDRLAFGLSLILAFSVGMAGALVVIALVAIRARDALASRVSVRLARSVPVAGAAVMLVAGLALAVSGGVRL